MFKFSKTKKQGSALVAENKRQLTVEVLEARNILACDKKKGTSDSYVSCSLLDLGEREIKAESFRTQQKKGSLNPCYGETFVYGEHLSVNTFEH